MSGYVVNQRRRPLTGSRYEITYIVARTTLTQPCSLNFSSHLCSPLLRTIGLMVNINGRGGEGEGAKVRGNQKIWHIPTRNDVAFRLIVASTVSARVDAFSGRNHLFHPSRLDGGLMRESEGNDGKGEIRTNEEGDSRNIT